MLWYIISNGLFPLEKIFNQNKKLNKNLQQTECKGKKRKGRKRKESDLSDHLFDIYIYIFVLKYSCVNAFIAHRNAFMVHSKRSFLEHSSRRCLAEIGFLQKESSHYNFFWKFIHERLQFYKIYNLELHQESSKENDWRLGSKILATLARLL